MKSVHSATLLLAFATSTYAQFDFGGFSSGDSNTDNSNDGNDFFSGGDRFDLGGFGDISRHRVMIIAHAVLATVAFGFFFPLGGIMIRLASFPGLWLVHGLFQMFATLMYIAAFVLGILLIRASRMGLWDHYHPIIGYVLLGLLIFQPLLGMLHHVMFKRYKRRVFWSYAHIWLGRIIITLGIVNGGLGLQFAMEYPILPPPRAAIIGYSVGAGVMWLLYLLAIMIGESRRKRSFETVRYKDETDSSLSGRSRTVRRSRSHGGGGGARGSRYSKSEERRRYA